MFRSIPVLLYELLTQLLAAENPPLTFPAGKQLYHHLSFYISFHYVNYSLRHYPELPFSEFQKAFLKILFVCPLQRLFPCLFALPFLWLFMIVGFTLFLSFIYLLKKIIKFCMLLWLIPEELSFLFFLVTYSCNNFLILSPVSLKALWATLKHSYDRIQRFSNTI